MTKQPQTVNRPISIWWSVKIVSLLLDFGKSTYGTVKLQVVFFHGEVCRYRYSMLREYLMWYDMPMGISDVVRLLFFM